MKVSFKDFLFNFADVVRNLIDTFERDYKNLKGAEKKDMLDHAITNYVLNVIENIGINCVFKFVLKNLLINHIPYITQIIFDLIKTKIEGITK